MVRAMRRRWWVVLFSLCGCGPGRQSRAGDESTDTGATESESETGGETADPDAFAPFARSGSRLELRGVRFDGAEYVVEAYDRELDAPCDLFEFEDGVTRCVVGYQRDEPSPRRPTGLVELHCADGCDDADLWGREAVEGCGEAYVVPQDGQDPTVWRTQVVERPGALLEGDMYAQVWADSIEVRVLTEQVPRSELVGGEIMIETNQRGVGVRVWAGDDGSRWVLGPVDLRFDEVVVAVGWVLPMPFISAAYSTRDDCSEPVLCYSMASGAFGDEVWVASEEPVPDDQIFTTDGEACFPLPGASNCFDVRTPGEAELEPATVTAAMSGELEATVATLASGERLGVLSGPECRLQRVGDRVRCLPHDLVYTLSSSREASCQSWAAFQVEGQYVMRPSLGTCDPGGTVWEVVGELDPSSIVLERDGMCAPPPEPYADLWNALAPQEGEFPALGPLETF